jgi:hypothetical protein
VTDRGLFYRPIHSVKAALQKRRRRRRCKSYELELQHLIMGCKIRKVLATTTAATKTETQHQAQL